MKPDPKPLEPCVFSLRPDEWQVFVNGVVKPAVFNSKGAAMAGLQVELRRDAARAS